MKKLLAALSIAAFLALPLTAFASSTLLTGLVSYWKLDGNSNDSSGTNNGTDTSITYGDTYGIINQGANFTGTPDTVILSNSISGSGDYSISFWFKSTQTTNGDLIGQRTSNVGEFFITLNYSGTTGLEFDTYNSGYGFQNFQAGGPGVYNDGNWHNAVLTYTSATKVGVWYVDGAYINEATASKSIAMLSANGLYFGSSHGAGAYYDGDLDEVGIWSRVLTPTEVSELYNGGVGLQYPFVSSSPNQILFLLHSFWINL